MSFEKLDDPSLVLPRVCDVHGTLTRLGFVGYKVRGSFFYRQFVPLFEGGVKAQFVSRNISHISVVIVLQEEPAEHGRCWIKYGYPERYSKGKKIIEGFKALLSEETYLTVNLYPDRELREFEKSMAYVIECVKTKKIDMSWDIDGAEGVTKKELPPWEAVVMAVQQTLCSPRVRMTGDWWIEPETHEPQPELETLSLRRIAARRARLPNVDRRQMLRQVRVRPRNVNRGNR